MELCSLHFISDDLVRSYVASIKEGEPRSVSPAGVDHLTAGLAQTALRIHPAYAAEGLSLTGWEERVDRGISMLIRPPGRLFIDAGLPVTVARSMPIRLDFAGAAMGGGYIPARLIPQAGELFERNLRRNVKRMLEAEMNAVPMQVMMMEAVRYAAVHGMGLYEAVGVIAYDDPATWPPGARVLTRPSDKELLDRVDEAARPEPEPGLIARLLGRFRGVPTPPAESD
jgi:hypothetical protein